MASIALEATGSVMSRSVTGWSAASKAATPSGPASTTLPPRAHHVAAASASEGYAAIARSRVAWAASRSATCWPGASRSNAVRLAASTSNLGKRVTSPPTWVFGRVYALNPERRRRARRVAAVEVALGAARP